MTKQEAVEKLLSVARGELGYHERGDNITKYAQDYDYDTKTYGFDMNGSPWCDYFVDWCFFEAFGYTNGLDMTYQFQGCSGASCAMSAGYYQQYGAFSSSPEPGDQVFFYVSGGVNHTGIVEEVNGSAIVTIEGNSSDQVKRNQYYISDSKIAGFGKPRWSIVANASTEDSPAPSNDISTPSQPSQSVLQTMTGKYPLLTSKYARERRDEVLAMQYLLCLRGFLVEEDGYFGLDTENAVRQAQAKYGLVQDGECGSATWYALITNK